MALTEERIIAQVSVLPESKTIQVLWNAVVYRDEQEISRTNHRCAYGAEQKAQFLADVPDGQPYVDAVGWT